MKRSGRSYALVLPLVALSMPLLVPAPAEAQPPSQAGDRFEISRSYETSQSGSDGSKGSSRGSTSIVERVLAVTDAGVELEYDHSDEATEEDRMSSWQLPARVLRAKDGTFRLLNAEELERRVDSWLEKAGMARDMCGRWIFTWNAFQIDCDLASALTIVRAYDLGAAELREGAAYRDPAALTAVRLNAKSRGDSTVLVAMAAIDPEKVKRERAETDVVVAQLMGQPISFEEAFSRRVGDTITGTITITFELDAAGIPLRRLREQTVTTITAERTSNDTARDVVERRSIPRKD